VAEPCSTGSPPVAFSEELQALYSCITLDASLFSLIPAAPAFCCSRIVPYAAVAPSAQKQLSREGIQINICNSEKSKYQTHAHARVVKIQARVITVQCSKNARTCKDYHVEAMMNSSGLSGATADTPVGSTGFGSPEGERRRGGTRCRHRRGSPAPMSCKEQSPRPAEPSWR
jgi:hypothetical protein